MDRPKASNRDLIFLPVMRYLREKMHWTNVMNIRWRTILKCQEINTYLRQKHRMEKDFKCKSRGLRSLICYTSIKLENKVLSLHSILNQKDMPESNIFSYKGDNIKLFKNQKKYFRSVLFLTESILIMFVTMFQMIK